jgi:hypothetical protein
MLKQLLFSVCEEGSTSRAPTRAPSPSIRSSFLLLLLKMYYSSCCQNSVEKYHKESEQFILQLTNLAALIAPPDTKHTDFSQQNALLQNPNNKNNNNFFFFFFVFFPKETKYGVTTQTPASPSKTKKTTQKHEKQSRKQTHKWKREKTNWSFLLTKQAKSRRGSMMRAAAPFSFFSFRRQQTKTTQNKFTQESKTSKPPHPQLRVQETKTLMGKYKTGC